MVWPCKQDASEKASQTNNFTRQKSEWNIYFGINWWMDPDGSIALRILVGIAQHFTQICKRKTGDKKNLIMNYLRRSIKFLYSCWLGCLVAFTVWEKVLCSLVILVDAIFRFSTVWWLWKRRFCCNFKIFLSRRKVFGGCRFFELFDRQKLHILVTFMAKLCENFKLNNLDNKLSTK